MTHSRKLLMVGMFCTMLLSGTAINAEENNGVETPNVSAPGQTVAYEQADGSQPGDLTKEQLNDEINTEGIIYEYGNIYGIINLHNGYYRKVYIDENGVTTGNTFDGQIAYDAATNTLTFTNVKDMNRLTLTNMGDVTIKLVGDNSFAEGESIYADSTNLTITGNGSLNFDCTSLIGPYSSIWCDTLTIESGTINSRFADFRANKGITINGGNIDLDGALITGSQPSDWSKQLIDNSSQVTINGGNLALETSYQNDITSGTLTINGGTINIDSACGEAIKTNTTTINGGSLNIKHDGNPCITANDSIKINGGTLKAWTYSGISALNSSSITISPDLTIQVGNELTQVGAYNNESNVWISGESKPVNDVITGDVMYRTHVQYIGWQGWKNESNISGTSGQSLRLEAIDIKINNQDNLGIHYKTHVQDIGWQDWVNDGTSSGTTGKGLRLEAIAIELTGADADKYDVYYCVHAENLGWMSWAKNGEDAGTAGCSYRLEAIKIIVQPKDTAAPANLTSLPAFVQN